MLYSFAAFFALEFWTTSSHFEICPCVRRLSFPRDLSTPMFHWKWHCTQVLSQSIWLIRLLCTQIIRYSFILCRSFRHFQGFLAHREIYRQNRETVRWHPKPWVSRSNHESWKVWFISDVAFHTSWIRCSWGKSLFLPHWIRKEKWRSHKN